MLAYALNISIITAHRVVVLSMAKGQGKEGVEKEKKKKRKKKRKKEKIERFLASYK